MRKYIYHLVKFIKYIKKILINIHIYVYIYCFYTFNELKLSYIYLNLFVMKKSLEKLIK